MLFVGVGGGLGECELKKSPKTFVHDCSSS